MFCMTTNLIKNKICMEKIHVEITSLKVEQKIMINSPFK